MKFCTHVARPRPKRQPDNSAGSSGRLNNVKAPIFNTSLLLVCALLLVSAPAIYAQEQAKPRKHAMPMPGMQMGHQNHTPASDLRAALVSSWNSADTDRLAGLYGESAVIILPGGNLVTGRQSVHEFLQRQLTNQVHLTLTSIGFESSPELEVDFGVFSSSKIAENAKQQANDDLQPDTQLQGKYLIVVKRIGSDWKIQEMMFSGGVKSFD